MHVRCLQLQLSVKADGPILIDNNRYSNTTRQSSTVTPRIRDIVNGSDRWYNHLHLSDLRVVLHVTFRECGELGNVCSCELPFQRSVLVLCPLRNPESFNKRRGSLRYLLAGLVVLFCPLHHFQQVRQVMIQWNVVHKRKQQILYKKMKAVSGVVAAQMNTHK